MGAGPLISVITASRNRASYLLRKLSSLREQKLQPDLFEWVVSLDGGTDGSAAILERELRARPPAFQVTIAENPGPAGAAAARNHAVSLSSGRLLLLSDDDVLLPPGSLAAHVSAHREGQAAVIGDLRLPAELRVGGSREPFERLSDRRGRGLWTNITGANTSLPRTAFDAVGGYDSSFREYGGEDSDLGLRLKRHGYEVLRSPAAWAVHDGSVLADPQKAEAAGRAGVRVWRKLGGLEPALMLGVHPALLGLKSLVLATPLQRLLPRAYAEYERAYLHGARLELEAGND